MGCGSSSVAATSSSRATNGKKKPKVKGERAPLMQAADFDDLNAVWSAAEKSLEIKKYPARDLVVRRSGWKTIRIFVSSTFKDFNCEREVLVKKVFPDLRVWCEARRLSLVECDLRWGVPKDFNTEATLRSCLGEIDRCYQDNIMPFFVNMTSERVGWVPNTEEVPEAVLDQYKWVYGLSVTEMEIMHGAYRKDNPNSLFMLRNSSFLDAVPEEDKVSFVEGQPEKLQVLKTMIKKRFPDHRVHYYDAEYLGKTPDGQLELGSLEKGFAKVVYEFFKNRITEQYPAIELGSNPYLQAREQHESFMCNKSEMVLGRDDILSKVDEYVSGLALDVPLLLLGGAGCGKSSIMAKVAQDATTKARLKQIPGGKDWHVFYHFVGAVPGSTELELLLKRLLREMDVVNDATMPSDVDSAAQEACGALNNPNTRPTIIIVDALNQLDEETAAQLVSWVPRKLAPHIRCVFSMIPDTPQHKAFMSREPQPSCLMVTPLNQESKEAIVTEMLGKYNKQLDQDQMNSLTGKSSADNPLWLSIACEELRIFGQFRQITDKINQLADGLLELEMQILSRFEKENGGDLLVAALCLLEVSGHGLLETELLTILAEEDRLMPCITSKDEGAEKDDKGKEKSSQEMARLPAYKWSEVYRALKPFLRPFGDSGEGRLDFYHRSLSKAVRKKYFKNEKGEPKKEIFAWWHDKLADYFENCKFLHRKIEEYPVHLLACRGNKRLEAFLMDWSVFDAMFDIEFSSKLISLWRKGPGLERMQECYTNNVNSIISDESITKEDKSMMFEKISRLLLQAGSIDKAQAMATRALDVEKEAGSRPERMVELYHLDGNIQDEILRKENYMDESQIPGVYKTIDSYSKSADIRRGYSTRLHKHKLGTTLNRLGFYFIDYANLGGSSELSRADARQKGLECIDESLSIFEELKDDLHYADALTTKAVATDNDRKRQLELYEKALDIILRLVGELHVKTNRLFLNLGIHWETRRDYQKAFDYFLRWYKSCRELYGDEHPRTERPLDTMYEHIYQNIAFKRGIRLPKHPKNLTKYYEGSVINPQWQNENIDNMSIDSSRPTTAEY